MGVESLSGTPWHIEKMTRKEGEEKRHRARCNFYRKEDNHCITFPTTLSSGQGAIPFSIINIDMGI